MIKEIYGDNVILQPIEEEKISEGGIIIPDTANNKKNVSQGIVVMAGKGIHDPNTGKFIPTTVKKGDRVLYNSNCPILEDKEWEGLYLISEKDILNKIQ